MLPLMLLLLVPFDSARVLVRVGNRCIDLSVDDVLPVEAANAESRWQPNAEVCEATKIDRAAV